MSPTDFYITIVGVFEKNIHIFEIKTKNVIIITRRELIEWIKLIINLLPQDCFALRA